MKQRPENPGITKTVNTYGYTGQELRPYDGRPGSLAHLDLPSRIGRTLFYRSRESIKTIFSHPIGASAA